MLPNANPVIRKILGVILIIIGFAGMILPILPGWWVILIGLEIFGWRLVIDHRKPWSKIFQLKHDREKPLADN